MCVLSGVHVVDHVGMNLSRLLGVWGVFCRVHQNSIILHDARTCAMSMSHVPICAICQPSAGAAQGKGVAVGKHMLPVFNKQIGSTTCSQ